MNLNAKKVIAWGSAIGISGGVVVTILVFALNAYIKAEVKAEIAKEITEFPTIANVDNKLAILTDGIGDNTTALSELKTGQDEFKLLFIEYLQNEANR